MATPPKKTDVRKGRRYVVTPKGEAFDGEQTVKILVQDISDSGLLLVCNRTFAPGATLALTFRPSPSVTIECVCEVRHSSDLGTGVKIINMSEPHRRAFDRFLQEYYAQQLGRLG
jgi:hypothetical protein